MSGLMSTLALGAQNNDPMDDTDQGILHKAKVLRSLLVLVMLLALLSVLVSVTSVMASPCVVMAGMAGGRSRKNKIKAMDPFSKTGGLYVTDDRKFNAPPKPAKGKRRREGGGDDDFVRAGSLLLRTSGVASPPAKRPHASSASITAPQSPSGLGVTRPGAPGNPGLGAPTSGGTVVRVAPPPLAAAVVKLKRLPGESLQQFNHRVNAAAHERLQSANAAKVKGLSLRKKAKLAEGRAAKRAKQAEQAALIASKSLITSSGNAAAIKGLRSSGVDEDLVEDVLKGTDVVAFGERVEAPPTMPPKMAAYFDKLKRKSEAFAAARQAAGQQPGKLPKARAAHA